MKNANRKLPPVRKMERECSSKGSLCNDCPKKRRSIVTAVFPDGHQISCPKGSKITYGMVKQYK